MQTLYSTPYLHLYLHQTTHVTLELHWLDFVPSADFRASLLELMCLARQQQARALIADNRLLRALCQADPQWSGEIVFNGLSVLGGRRFAAVESYGRHSLGRYRYSQYPTHEPVFCHHRAGPGLGDSPLVVTDRR